MILHWGIGAKTQKEWVAPSEDIYPIRTKKFDNKAVQTKFQKKSDESKPDDYIQEIVISFKINSINSFKSLNFVINDPLKVIILKNKTFF